MTGGSEIQKESGMAELYTSTMDYLFVSTQWGNTLMWSAAFVAVVAGISGMFQQHERR